MIPLFGGASHPDIGIKALHELVKAHVQETDSVFAANIDAHWDLEVEHFWQICPKEMIDRLEHPLSDAGEVETLRA